MNRLKELRQKNNLTLKELGQKVGMANNTLSQYENGKREPKLETWKVLADFFNVSVPYLQGYIKAPYPASDQPDFTTTKEQTIMKQGTLIKLTNGEKLLMMDNDFGFEVYISNEGFVQGYGLADYDYFENLTKSDVKKLYINTLQILYAKTIEYFFDEKGVIKLGKN